MIRLDPEETILLTMRRHWFALVAPGGTFLVMLVVPPLALYFGAPYFPLLRDPAMLPVVKFGLAIYLAAVATAILLFWLDYYLDVWIITDRRIIDIEQYGLFHREISEIAMERIQNVTIEIPGFIPTLLNFGNMRIETAGEGKFTIASVPHCHEAKDVILRQSHIAREEHPIERRQL